MNLAAAHDLACTHLQLIEVNISDDLSRSVVSIQLKFLSGFSQIH